MLAKIIILAMGCVTWDMSKIPAMSKFGLSVGQEVVVGSTSDKTTDSEIMKLNLVMVNI